MSFHHRPAGPGEPIRVRMPRPGEILGIVTQLHGGARMMVHCEDGKDRMCRVPGKIKRFIWVKENDYVLVEPWEVEGDQKADIVFRYTRIQVEQLKQKGVIKA